MESISTITPSFLEADSDLTMLEPEKQLNEGTEYPINYTRPISPSSDASTSGVCSMASSDVESSEENVEEKAETKEEKVPSCPVRIFD